MTNKNTFCFVYIRLFLFFLDYLRLEDIAKGNKTTNGYPGGTNFALFPIQFLFLDTGLLFPRIWAPRANFKAVLMSGDMTKALQTLGDPIKSARQINKFCLTWADV